MPPFIDKEKARKTIAHILDKVKTEADPWMLGEYHRLIKKEVSLFHRSKVAAYLLMLCDQGKTLRSAKNTSRAPEEDVPRSPPLAEDESKWLFFSVGRSRHIFPGKILGLINEEAAIPREDIGAIRILDNYSFVQVRNTVAETVIETLNGIMFRGKPLTVNYAKSRKDEEGGSYSSEKDQDHPEEENI
jgi:hypothetical protein